MNEENISPSEPVLGKDIPWDTIKGELCRVIEFVPLGSVKDGKVWTPNVAMPYGSLTIECKELPNQKAKWLITHRIDFMHLWEVFKERKVKEDEEVLVGYYRYRTTLGKLFSSFFPKIYIMIYPKGSFEKFTDQNWQRETKGEAWAREMTPIAKWDPSPNNRFLY